MSDIITLSSEDEELQPPKKRAKLIAVSNGIETEQGNNCIVLSDDDDKDDGTTKPVSLAAVSVVQLPKQENDQNTVSENENCEELNGKSVAVNGNTSTDPMIPDLIQTELTNFLDSCIKSIKPENRMVLENKALIVQQLYEKVRDVDDIHEFRQVLEMNSKKVTSLPEGIAIWYKDVYEWLKTRYKHLQDKKAVTVSHAKIIKKLEKSLKLLRKRIKEFEESSDWEDEDGNSIYVKLNVYRERAVKVYNKLCKYRQINPNYGRIYCSRLDFSKSKYPEINDIINRNYKTNKELPDYASVNKLIRKCVTQKGIQISEPELTLEIKVCFEALGSLLQQRRKMDLYEVQSGYLPHVQDPTIGDPEIEKALGLNRKERFRKEDEIMAKYVLLQETGTKLESSSDSDDSNFKNSDSDENIVP